MNSHSTIGRRLEITHSPCKSYLTAQHQLKSKNQPTYNSDPGANTRLCLLRAFTKIFSKSSGDVFPIESTEQLVIHMTRPLFKACVPTKTISIVFLIIESLKMKNHTFKEWALDPEPLINAACAGVGFPSASIAVRIPISTASTEESALLLFANGGPAFANASVI